MSASSVWSLGGTVATLSSNSIRGVVQLDAPERGLHGMQILDNAVDGWLFGVTLDGDASSWRVADAFVRGRDLIATYRRTDDEPFAVKAYWRLVASDCAGAVLDAIVSLETRAWEAYPAVTIVSALAGECTATPEGPLAWRLSPERWYGEASRAGDFTMPGCETVEGGLTASSWRFSEQFMERGVIRRLHVRGVFAPAERAAAAIGSIPAQLAAEPPPLTA